MQVNKKQEACNPQLATPNTHSRARNCAKERGEGGVRVSAAFPGINTLLHFNAAQMRRPGDVARRSGRVNEPQRSKPNVCRGMRRCQCVRMCKWVWLSRTHTHTHAHTHTQT